MPGRPDAQQMMVHLDIAVPDVHEAVASTRGAGGRRPSIRGPKSGSLDPDGHPFCLFP